MQIYIIHLLYKQRKIREKYAKVRRIRLASFLLLGDAISESVTFPLKLSCFEGEIADSSESRMAEPSDWVTQSPKRQNSWGRTVFITEVHSADASGPLATAAARTRHAVGQSTADRRLRHRYTLGECVFRSCLAAALPSKSSGSSTSSIQAWRLCDHKDTEGV